MNDLGTSKLFHSLPPAESQALAQCAEVKAYADGQLVFQAGDPGDGVYVIGAGVVQISVMANPTEHRVLTRLGPGDFFGEMAVLDNEPRSATAAAVGGTTLYFLPRAAMLAALNRSPSLAFSMVREFSLRMRDFNRHYLEEVLQAERLALVGRFARSIVHDFKNPLAIISFAADLLSVKTPTPETCGVTHARIRKQVDRLSNMINELLEFTSGSQAADVLALTDYGAFVRQLVADLQPELDDKAVTMVWENPPPTRSLLVNPRRLAHAFTNLIHNAVDAMPGGGKILLRFIVHDQELVTEIEDAGPGIAPEVAAHLFEPFVTFGKPHGTGLGLSICQRILGDHHGRIQAHNRPGGGAIFSLSLPLPP